MGTGYYSYSSIISGTPMTTAALSAFSNNSYASGSERAAVAGGYRPDDDRGAIFRSGVAICPAGWYCTGDGVGSECPPGTYGSEVGKARAGVTRRGGVGCGTGVGRGNKLSVAKGGASTVVVFVGRSRSFGDRFRWHAVECFSGARTEQSREHRSSRAKLVHGFVLHVEVAFTSSAKQCCRGFLPSECSPYLFFLSNLLPYHRTKKVPERPPTYPPLSPPPRHVLTCKSWSKYLPLRSPSMVKPGLSDSACSGVCAAGFYCGAGATTPTESVCGASGFYCPVGASTPSRVLVGYYGVHAGIEGALQVNIADARHIGRGLK